MTTRGSGSFARSSVRCVAGDTVSCKTLECSRYLRKRRAISWSAAVAHHERCTTKSTMLPSDASNAKHGRGSISTYLSRESCDAAGACRWVVACRGHAVAGIMWGGGCKVQAVCRQGSVLDRAHNATLRGLRSDVRVQWFCSVWDIQS